MSAVVSKKSILCAPVAQLDRASDYGSEGWGFEFLQAHGRKSPGDYCWASRPRLSKVGVLAFAGTTACGFGESVDASIGYRGEKAISRRASGYRGEHPDIAASLGGISCSARVSCK
jgi:hypothetical protein